MDSNEKDRTRTRHLRGAAKFEEKKANRQELRQRGERRPSRMRGDDDPWDRGDWEDEESLDLADRPSRSRSPRSHSKVLTPNARVSGVARTQVTVLPREGGEVIAQLTPHALAQGGVVVGDEVELDGSGRVVGRAERRTVLERRSPGRSKQLKILAANVDVGLVVMAPRGETLSLGFIDRALLALQGGGIEPLLVVTKVDLLDHRTRELLSELLLPWSRAGFEVHWIGSPTGEGVDGLRDRLQGNVSVMLGQSGVGKSTLVNALDPTALQLTGETREVDSRGRHTTTSSRLIPMAGGGALVDTPGIRQLAPDVSSLHDAAKAYPELQPYLGGCRFPDCAHLGESGCALEEAAVEQPEVRRGLDRLRRFIEAQEE